MLKPTIAIAENFLDAFSRIPHSQQKKVREFTQKFRENPQSAAINFEKIHGVRDNKVRTVRIDQKYRAVILQPDQGNVYVLAWVDNHDEAMAWAKNKLFEINPATGALQVINVSEVEGQSASKKKSSGRLFDAVEDPTLLSLGIPAVLLPAIRAVADKSSLLDLSKHLPAEATEGLAWLSEGIPPDEIKDYLSQKPPKEINTADFATALNNPDSRRRFVTISTEGDLDKILDAPLEKWRVFLHPSQEELVRVHFNGPARVLGGAGTGKTVVAMHRTRHLARDIFVASSDRTLFTTFTANLAKGISRSLKRLCGTEFARIEVLNLHAVAAIRPHFRIATVRRRTTRNGLAFHQLPNLVPVQLGFISEPESVSGGAKGYGAVWNGSSTDDLQIVEPYVTNLTRERGTAVIISLLLRHAADTMVAGVVNSRIPVPANG